MLSQSPPKNNPFDSGAAQRAVVDYLSRGWRLIPLGANRTPLVRWTDFTCGEQTFTQVWTALGDPRCAGVAVALGQSGLICRDYDTLEGYAEFQARHPVEATMLPTARTARGFHVYARSTAPARTVNMGDGEFRAGNAYTVLPPSRHESGHTYQWVVPLPEGELPTVGGRLSHGAADRLGCGAWAGCIRHTHAHYTSH